MTDAFEALSVAVSDRVKAASSVVIGLEWGTHHRISAILWGDGIAVTTEQSLPDTDGYIAILPGGARVIAMLVGRDSSTNVAALRLDARVPDMVAEARAPEVGGLVLALGSDGSGGPLARLGIVAATGPAWQSQCGGRIDRLIRLDVALGHDAEGGPVLDCHGHLLGMSTFCPRSQVLVIPSATIDRVVAQLLAHGCVPRGWLGVGVQPVQIPCEMENVAGVSAGLMVLSIAEGSPACGKLLQGDVLLAANGGELPTPRALTLLLGAEAIGARLALRLLRGGTVAECHVGVAGRPA